MEQTGPAGLRYTIFASQVVEEQVGLGYVSGPGLGSGWCVSTCGLLAGRVLRQHREKASVYE